MSKTAPNPRQEAIKGRAKASLTESLSAVSAALDSMPDNVVKMPGSLRDTFLLIDPVLSGLNRQLLDARAHIAAIIAEFGYGDPMAEALMYQMAALERAYCERLYALRKKREEGESAVKGEVSTEEKTMPEVRQHQEYHVRQNHGAMWSLAALFLIHRHSSSAKNKGGLVLKAA